MLICRALASDSRSSGNETFVARLTAVRGRLAVSMKFFLVLWREHAQLVQHINMRMITPNNWTILSSDGLLAYAFTYKHHL